ncbi:MAG: hypothetical protein ACYC57_07645 [Thermoleophilia bacterium]
MTTGRIILICLMLASVLLLSAAYPVMADGRAGSAAASSIKVEVEVQTTLALSTSGDTFAPYPVSQTVDAATGIPTYSVIDG